MRRVKTFRAAGLFILLGVLMPAGALLAQGTADRARMAFENKEYVEAARLFREAVAEDPDDEDILIDAGDAFMALEYHDTAAEFYRLAYNEDSRNGEANLKLGTALSLMGEHDEAIEMLRRAYKYDEQSLDSRLALGDAYIRMGTDSLGQAEIAILGANKEFPNNPRVKAALGDLYFHRGVYNLSEDYYKEAIDLDPERIQSRIGLAVSLREVGRRGGGNERYLQALEQANAVTKIAPGEPVPWKLQGEILLLVDKNVEAFHSFNEYRRLRPDDPYGHYMAAYAASAANAYSDAIGPAREVLSRNDERSKSFHSLARVLIARGYYSRGQTMREENPDSARYYYGEAARAYTETPDSALESNDFIFQGNAWFWQGDTAKGVAVWSSYIDAFPDSCQAAYNLARGLYQMDQHRAFLTTLDRIEARCGENFQKSVPLLRGLAWMQLDSAAPAVAALSQAIALDSTNVDAFYWMLNTLVSEKRYEEITPIVDAAVRNVPGADNAEKLAWINYFGGVAAYNQENLKEAIAYFDAATDLKADHSAAYLYKAVSYHTLKDKENACANYRKTLQYDPGNSTAKTNLSKLGC